MSQNAEPNRIVIFDTTLRDGEQSPGASMNLEEKLRIAEMLAELGADPLLPNEDGTTPIMVAAGVGTQAPGEDPGTEPEVLEAVKVALELGVGLNAANAQGQTAVSAALADGVEKVAIVDFDVHHGNGTQQIFYDDPRVLFISIHQSPFYPWTGAVSEIGRGKGTGFNVNIPVTAGATDGDYMLLFDQVVLPILREFGSQVLLISAGYDAHLNDPIGAMRISTDGFGMMTRKLKDVAVEQSKGRMVLVTEGGYDLTALAGSLESTIASLEPTGDLVPPSGFTAEASSGIGADALEKVLSVQRTYWSTL